MTGTDPGTPTVERLARGGPRPSVGMLTADLSRLGAELASIESAGVELVHVDVMDGVLVPQLTFGAPIVKAVRAALGPGVLVDAHLLVHDPLARIPETRRGGSGPGDLPSRGRATGPPGPPGAHGPAPP